MVKGNHENAQSRHMLFRPRLEYKSGPFKAPTESAIAFIHRETVTVNYNYRNWFFFLCFLLSNQALKPDPTQK